MSHALFSQYEAAFVLVGIEARGFIFGPPIALAIGAKFVPLRKPRKLPGIFLPSVRSLFLLSSSIVAFLNILLVL